MSTISIERERALRQRVARALKSKSQKLSSTFETSASRPYVGTKLYLEGVHFDLNYTTGQELGKRLVTIGANAMACAGIRPEKVAVVLGMRQDTHEIFLSEFFTGVHKAAKAQKIQLSGADLTVSPTAMAVNVVFSGKPIRKSKSQRVRIGDLLAVSGPLGTSAAGLECLKKIGRENLHNWDRLVRAHLEPPSQVVVVEKLLKIAAVREAVLLNEGFAMDMNLTAEKWGLGAILKESSLPITEAIHWAGRSLNVDPQRWVLYGGEDQQLLVVLDPKKSGPVLKRFGLNVVGEVVEKKLGVKLLNKKEELQPFLPRAWNDLVRRTAPLA
ncbi:MAG: AIR synthase related protein [Bdellovibrionota bacterium]